MKRKLQEHVVKVAKGQLAMKKKKLVKSFSSVSEASKVPVKVAASQHKETSTKALRDHLGKNVEVLFCGINPGRYSYAAGAHYANKANHFWPLLHQSGLIDEPFDSTEEHRVLDYNLGLTNIVDRMTPGSNDVSRKEMQDNQREFVKKIQQCEDPAVVVLNGKCIYDALIGSKKPVVKAKDFSYGVQPMNLATRVLPLSMARKTKIFVIPSTSPRVSTHQKADKLVFFKELYSLREEAKLKKCEE